MKRNSIGVLLAGLVSTALLFTACPGTPGGDIGGGGTGGTGGDTPAPGKSYIEIAENIVSSMELEKGKTYYINKTISIKDGGSLISKGQEDKPVVVKLSGSGRIIVTGTGSMVAENTIFTSVKDCTVGESILSNSEPMPGDHRGIEVRGTASFTKCSFLYAGNSKYPALNVYYESGSTGKARVDNCYFADNGGEDDVDGTPALKYDYRAYEYDPDVNCVTNTTFERNIWPLSIPANFSLDGSNTFQDNRWSGIYLKSLSVSVKKNVVLENQSVPYYVEDGNLSVYAGGSLTIKGGKDEEHPTQFLFASGKKLNVKVDGKISVGSNTHFGSIVDGTTWAGIIAETKEDGKTIYNCYYSTEEKNILIENIDSYPTTSSYRSANF